MELEVKIGQNKKYILLKISAKDFLANPVLINRKSKIELLANLFKLKFELNQCYIIQLSN